jgi:hypothetical protein
VLVVDYHRRTRVKLPNQRLHAAIHVAVENQIAMGDELPVHGVLDRLQAEGLDRHDAIHAIGSALAEHMGICLRAVILRATKRRLLEHVEPPHGKRLATCPLTTA